jgi:beta-N-acetylhexosaminidase
MSLSQQPPGDPALTRPAQSRPARNSSPFTPATTRRSRRPLAVALAMLAALVVVGSLIGQRLLSGAGGQVGQAARSEVLASGPFITPPLDARQVDQLMNLKNHMQYRALASLYVAHMSLDEEIGQLIMLEYNQPYYSSDLDYAVNTLHVGGVIMYALQLTGFRQARGDIAHMQRRAKIPLIISTDEEGGPYVERLGSIYGPRMSATDIFNTGNPAVAAQQGLKTSRDLAALGINSDLAPDVDVNQVNGYDMVTRTFGTTAQQVIRFAGPYLRAMQANGTIACIKHYPGLGGASPDAHTTLPVVNSSRAQIYATDLAPFKAFIQSPDRQLNPGMIMPTDVLMPAIDPTYPAELSHIFMTDILRKEFGYDGVVLTDALYMQGITNQWSMPQAAVIALNASNDMLLGPNGPDETIAMLNAVKAALQNGTLAKARVDEAVTRIMALKMAYHLMPAIPPQP